MHKALHPHNNQKITVAEHIMEFGNYNLETWERARCPFCKCRMGNKAASSPNSDGHFFHMPNSGYCPSKEHSGTLYASKHPRAPDLIAARRMKLHFLQNWGKHFRRINWIVKGLEVNEFKDLIRLADQERIWEYAALQEYQLPYIFSTLKDFPVEESLKVKDEYIRKYYFRCWFDSSVRQYDDLWIHRAEPPMFYRAWFIQPKRGKPKMDDIAGYYSMEMSGEFLDDPKEPSLYVIANIQTWLDQRYANIRE